MSTRMMALEYAAVADAQDDAGIAEVRQVTHDRLLAATGAQRCSGVSWRQIPAADGEAIELVLALLERTDVSHTPLTWQCAGHKLPFDREAVVNLRRFLARNQAGALVIAECEYAR